MKSLRQLVLRRTQAPKRAVLGTLELTPVDCAMRSDIPSEVIDLRVTPLPSTRPRISNRLRQASS